MIPIIANIYGPITIHSYGFALAVGLLFYLWLLQKDQIIKSILTKEQLSSIFMRAIVAGIIGGRVLFVFSTPEQITFWHALQIWEGGLSFLGGLIAILIVVPFYVKNLNIPLLPLLDRASLYAPLLYVFARIGCFLAGCCYGMPTSLPWAIVYKHPESRAPLCIALHPTQFYSALISLMIFFVLYAVVRLAKLVPGQLLAWYLILASSERFSVDFWRADRLFLNSSSLTISLFSIDQFIAIATFFLGIGLLLWSGNKQHNINNEALNGLKAVVSDFALRASTDRSGGILRSHPTSLKLRRVLLRHLSPGLKSLGVFWRSRIKIKKN